MQYLLMVTLKVLRSYLNIYNGTNTRARDGAG